MISKLAKRSLLACLVLVGGCFFGGSDQPEAETRPEVVDPAIVELGWFAEVGAYPSRFADLTEKSKPGWVALHANDYDTALDAFGAGKESEIGRARASLSLAILYEDLSRYSGLVNEALFSTWLDRGTLPPGDNAPMVAALAAHCGGGETIGVWAARVSSGPDTPITMAISQGRSPFDVETAGPYGHRMAIHHAARTAGDRTALLAAAAVPIVTVNEAEFVRKFWDPCIWRSLADISLDAAVRDGSEGKSAPPDRSLAQERWRRLDLGLAKDDALLGARLFAPWPTTGDLKAELQTASGPSLLGSRSPSLRRMGVGTGAFPSDDPEAAKEEVRLLDAGLDAVQRKVSDLGNAEGIAVVNDLRLIHRFRQEWLVVQAREALARKHPQRALTYLELARDHASNAVGPENVPSIYALTAEARLALGRTREALDALHVLAVAQPEVLGLVEVTGDLAVLQGLDRQGDSKEE